MMMLLAKVPIAGMVQVTFILEFYSKNRILEADKSLKREPIIENPCKTFTCELVTVKPAYYKTQRQ